MEHLRTVFQKIRESGLTLKMAKCKWAYHETEFLGHRIGGGHIQPLEAKTEVIRNYIRPNSKKQVSAFLGLSGYYRKFIRNYAGITAPISDLTKKDQTNKFTWTDEAEKAFQKIKEALSTNPILMSPDDRKPYLLQTDASGRGLGAVLNQEDDEGNQRPVAYFSRKLKDRETRYHGTQLECLALVDAVHHFPVYLSGKKFRVQTDSRALTYLEKFKEQNALLMQWALRLQSYVFNIEHRSGTANANADGLSRQYSILKMPTA